MYAAAARCLDEIRTLLEDSVVDLDVLREAVEHAKKQSHSELLKQVVTTDQSARKEYSAHMQKHGGDWKAARKSWIAQKKTSPGDIFGDRAGHKKIKKAEPHFDHSKFSGKDWHHYWLHAQHSDQDPAYQRHALGVIKKHLGSEHAHYKYLHDRISCSTKGKQRYGTQDICEK